MQARRGLDKLQKNIRVKSQEVLMLKDGGNKMNNEFRCTYKGQKIDMGIIETVERKLGFIFPDSYKNYVINNNGGHIEGTYNIIQIFSF